MAPRLTGPSDLMATIVTGPTFGMFPLGLIERERFVLQARLRSCRDCRIAEQIMVHCTLRKPSS